MQSLCVLGRQPKLGLAELESLYGDKVSSLGANCALLDIEPKLVNFARLGGTVKFCKVLTEVDSTDWSKIQGFLNSAVPEHAKMLPEGKLKLGLSVVGLKVDVKRINATALSIKKTLTKYGRSTRVVPNKTPMLSSAQVLHNKLTSQLGWELVIVANGNKTIIAQNIAEQDIDAYSARDHGRPKRDSKVGMLPPKLAQILINLAAGEQKLSQQACEPTNSLGLTLLDPFCGTGVVLQEAALMGYEVCGTDLEQRMIDYSRTNLDWLGENFAHPPFSYQLDKADATDHSWEKDADLVASEAYLSTPFTSEPPEDKLKDAISVSNVITKKFLNNLAEQTLSGFRLCVAVPAWHYHGKVIHLPILDQLTDMGYTRVSFRLSNDDELIYHREGQVVGRELVTLIRK